MHNHHSINIEEFSLDTANIERIQEACVQKDIKSLHAMKINLINESDDIELGFILSSN